jgi:glucan-binding YG repeat protein
LVTSENYTQYGVGKFYVWKAQEGLEDLNNAWRYFGPDGKLLQGIWEHPDKGDLYYFKDGRVKEMRLFEYNGDYYFSLYNGKLVTSENYTQYAPGKYYVWDVQPGLEHLNNSWRYFGPDGKLLQGIWQHPEKEERYFFKDGRVKEMGLFKYSDGNYYVTQAGGMIITSENYTKYAPGKYYVWKIDASANDKQAGWYYFDAEGKMIIK